MVVRKKIAVLTPVLPPYHGGIGKVALAEAEYLARAHEVIIFTPKYSYIDKNEEQRGEVKIKYIKPFFAFGNAAIIRDLKKELQNFDVVYLHYPFFGTAEFLDFRFHPAPEPSARYRAGISDFRFVIRYHMDVVGRGLLKPIFWLHTKFLMPRILQRADKIIASTLDYADNSNIKYLFKKYSEKFTEIPFGTDIEKFKPTPKDAFLLEKYGLRSDDKIILFVGGLDKAHYFKGLGVLLHAISDFKFQISNFRLIIVGDGDMKKKYETVVKKLGITDVVKFVGSVANDDLSKYYNLADVFVFPSIDSSEAFGLALLEAVSCGKAVVASNLPGVRTLVQDGKNGFLARPGDIIDLSEKIFKTRNNSELFGREGRQLVEEKYPQEKIANQLLDFFDKLC